MASTADRLLPLLVAACLAACGGEPPTPEPDDPEPEDTGVPDTDPPDDTDVPTTPAPPCMASICWTPGPEDPDAKLAGRILASGRDLQGDGYDELAIAAPGFSTLKSGIVWMVHGGPDIGDEIVPTSRWDAGPLTYFGEQLALSGDVTGDGIGDVLAVNMDGAGNALRGYVLEGPLDVDGHADDAVSAALAHEEWVADLRPWPDTNGDGLDEVVVLWWGRFSYETPTRIGVFETPLPPVLRAGQEDFGLSMPWRTANRISNPGDMDGDGVPELLSLGSGPGPVGIHLHSLEPGVQWHQDDYLPTWTGSEHMESTMQTGIDADWDGDGYLDGWASTLVDGTTRGGTTWLLFGPPDASESLDDVPRIEGSDFEQLGLSVVAGDLDGDGHADLIMGAPGDAYFATLPGRVYAFLGPIPRARLEPEDADHIWEGEHPVDSFGRGLAVGDFDGDGRDDLAIGAPRNDEAHLNAGKVYLFLGKDL